MTIKAYGAYTGDLPLESMDITRRSHLKANGGNGYDYLLTTFIPQLRQSGFSQADVDTMLRDNPSQFFQ